MLPDLTLFYPESLFMSRKTYEQLRSARWFAPDDLRSFGHRSRAMQMGYGPEDWAGKPVIALVNTWSDINPCHTHFKQRVDDVNLDPVRQVKRVDHDQLGGLIDPQGSKCS